MSSPTLHTPPEQISLRTASLRLGPRPTHIALDLALKLSLDNHAPSPFLPALHAACIFTAWHLTKNSASEMIAAEKIVAASGLDIKNMRSFWGAYRLMWEKRHELVTGEILCHGAKIENLPEPGPKVERDDWYQFC